MSRLSRQAAANLAGENLLKRVNAKRRELIEKARVEHAGNIEAKVMAIAAIRAMNHKELLHPNKANEQKEK